MAITRESARDWYEAYGWSMSTAREGDVCLQAVDYDWLDESDEQAIILLQDNYSELGTSEARDIVSHARGIRETAESIEGLHDTAATQYEGGDLLGSISTLRDAERIESDHGDSPATQYMWRQLFSPRAIGTRIGQAIALDVLADGLPHDWTGIDPQDGDILTAAGIECGSQAWKDTEFAADQAYRRAIREHRKSE